MHAYSVMDQNRAMKEDKGMYGEAQQHTQRPFTKCLKQHTQRPFSKRPPLQNLTSRNIRLTYN